MDNDLFRGAQRDDTSQAAKNFSVRVWAVRMLTMVFSGLVFAAASAHAAPSDVNDPHIATGAIDVGDLDLSDRDVFTDGNFLDQHSREQGPQVTADESSGRLSGVLEKAETMIGIPYLWGGNTPEEGLDCSGFVRYVYEKAAGILLPRLSAQISRKGSAIAQSDLHPGDLVFFNTPRGEATHVGIYIGEHRFIHAPKRGAFIRIESMKSAYWTSRYYGARRVLA
jgi:cell wall-associated NlpC family hydrolase